MKLSDKLLWILYCAIAAGTVSYLDSVFEWGLF
jgi:hypothetical protein